jgi:epoxyqueuosine reductase
VRARVCVDTAPLLEHEAARLAGIGFTAKSTLTIVPGVGSFVLLGELLLDVELPPATPVRAGCGSCRACLDACPTGAFVDAHVLDARRCISYLTIENQGPIPRELRAAIGTRVFGCDVCQDVCPFNASAAPKPRAPELLPREALEHVDLVGLLTLGAAGYRRLVRRTALRRVTVATLARNAAVALGNSGDPRAKEPLLRALGRHRSALVRGHAAWALGRLGAASEPAGRDALLFASEHDPDDGVRSEARAALEASGPG